MLAIGCLAFISCWGGGGGLATTTTTETATTFSNDLTINGSVELPTTASSSLSNTSYLLAAEDVGVEGCEIHAYTLEGVEIGDPDNPTLTDANGAYVLPVSLEQIRPTTVDDESADFSADVIIEALCDPDSHDPTIVENFLRSAVTPGTTNELTIKQNSIYSDLAMEYVKMRAFAENTFTTNSWGDADLTGSILEGKDLKQVFVASMKMVLNGDTSNTGMYKSVGVLTSAYKGFVAGGGKATSVGYTSKSDMLSALLKGDFSSGAGYDSFINVASTALGVETSKFSDFATARSNFDKVGSALVSQATADLALDEDQFEELAKIMMVADTTTTFDSVVGSTGILDHFVKMAKQTSNLTEEAAIDPHATFGMMAQIAKDPTKTFTDEEYLDLVNVASDDQIKQCADETCKKALGQNMLKAIEQHGFGIVDSDAGITAILKDMKTTIVKGETIVVSKYNQNFVNTGGQPFPFGGNYSASTTCRGLVSGLQLMFSSTNGTTYTQCENCPSRNIMNISGGQCTGLTSGPTNNPQSCGCTKTSGIGGTGTTFNISCAQAGPLQACSTTLTKQ